MNLYSPTEVLTAHDIREYDIREYDDALPSVSSFFCFCLLLF